MAKEDKPAIQKRLETFLKTIKAIDYRLDSIENAIFYLQKDIDTVDAQCFADIRPFMAIYLNRMATLNDKINDCIREFNAGCGDVKDTLSELQKREF